MSRPHPITLSPATHSDLPILATVGRQTFLETFQAHNASADIDTYVSTAFGTERLARELAIPDSQTFLLWVGSEVAGYLKLNRHPAQTEPRSNAGSEDAMEIERLYLLHAFQGRGLGRLLMDAALARARQSRLSKVWLGVWERNTAAIAFYRHSGFSVTGEHVFQLGGDAQRDLIMERTV